MTEPDRIKGVLAIAPASRTSAGRLDLDRLAHASPSAPPSAA